MLGNCTWTIGSNIVNTDVSYSSAISVGDMIGIPTASGNGADESFYRVTGRSGTQITLAGYYAGPSNVTVGGIKVQTAVPTGPNPGYACNITVGCTVSGGWELSATPAQNGETWIRCTGARTASQNIGIGLSTSGIILDRMNVADSYYCLSGAGSSPTITNCTFTNSYAYTIYSIATGYLMSQVRVGHNDGPSWSCFYPAASNGTINNLVVSSYASASAIAVQCSAVTHNFANVTVRGAGYGFACVSGTVLLGGTAYKCNWGVSTGNSITSIVIKDMNISHSNTYGIASSSQSQGALIQNCTLDQNSRHIYMGQTHGARIEGCLFSNSVNYDIEIDQYSGFIYSVNNSHITPGIRAYQRASSSGPFYIINCTIDAGSVAKVFAQTANGNAIMPQFYIQDSFFGLTGQYYGRFEVVKNTGTTPPSVQLKFNTTVQNYYADQKVASTYTRQGVGKTLSFKLTSMSSGWAGSLVPKVKLNGITIQTEPTITSVSFGSDDSYSFVIPGGSITQDGELSIEFTANANTVAILVKEFTVS